MELSATVVAFTCFILGALTMYSIFMTIYALRKESDNVKRQTKKVS